MEVLVAGWVGSTNLGDELVHAGVRRLLAAAGAERLTVVSTSPEATGRLHGPEAISHRDLPALWRAVSRADLVVVGGGGVVQDLTSRFNLPYHLSRAWLATLRDTPWVGLALGVGPIVTGTGRRLARFLERAEAVSVRDRVSADTLAACGVRDVEITADAAFALPVHDEPPDDVITVSLRPWGGGGGTLPVGARRDPTPPWFVPEAAAALDALAQRTGLRVELVALQTDRDHQLQLQVQGSMRTPATCVQPTLDELVPAIGRGRVVVAMRYHAAVAATLAGRPVVTIGYASKVQGLTAELGEAATLLPWEPDALAALPDRVAQVEPHTGQVLAARDALTARAWRNVDVISSGLAAR